MPTAIRLATLCCMWSVVALAAPWAMQTSSAGVTAIGEYRFGMTRDDVRRVTSCSPYQEVPSTRGLECKNFLVDGRQVNISFLFTDGGLSRVQLSFYEGLTEQIARLATTSMLSYLTKRGALRSDELATGVRPTTDSLFKALHERNKSREGARVQVLTPKPTRPPFVHGELVQALTGYYVLVFLDVTSPASQQ